MLDFHTTPDTFLLTERDLARRWQVAEKTLRNARVSGTLVPYVKIGRLCRYRLADVLAFEESQRHLSTSLPR